MMRKNIALIFGCLSICAGCVVVEDTPPAPRHYPIVYSRMNGPMPPRRVRPMHDRGPAQKPAAKRPNIPAHTAPAGVKNPPSLPSKRGLPPTVR